MDQVTAAYNDLHRDGKLLLSVLPSIRKDEDVAFIGKTIDGNEYFSFKDGSEMVYKPSKQRVEIVRREYHVSEVDSAGLTVDEWIVFSGNPEEASRQVAEEHFHDRFFWSLPNDGRTMGPRFYWLCPAMNVKTVFYE